MSQTAPFVVRKAGTTSAAPTPLNPFNGGARPNSGRKREEVRKALAASAPPEAEDADGLTPDELVFVDFATARARKESAAAAMAELQYRIKSSEYVSRDSVQAAVASALAAMAQSLRSIPDNIERKIGVDPEVAQEVGFLIDEAMDSLADELERMARDGF
jgi:hypothetical protein